MAWETEVQSQVESSQRLEKWYLIPPCLTLSIIRYVSRVKWSNPGEGVVPSPILWCSSYWKGSLRVALDYRCQLYLLYMIGKHVLLITSLNEPKLIFGYIIPNLLYTYTLNIYPLVWFYGIYIICKHILLMTSLNESKLILLHTIKWFQVFLYITKNSAKHQSFVYTQLNDQTVLFQTIQFSLSHLFALSLNVKPFYLTHR